MANGKSNGKLSAEDFTLQAIETLRDVTRSMGIHSVFSGFNAAYREYYDGADPVAATTALAKAGKVGVQMRKRGAMLYIPGEAPKADPGAGAAKALAAMGLK